MEKVTIRFGSKRESLDFCAKYAIDSEVEVAIGGVALTFVVSGFESYHGAVQVHLRAKKGEQ